MEIAPYHEMMEIKEDMNIVPHDNEMKKSMNKKKWMKIMFCRMIYVLKVMKDDVTEIIYRLNQAEINTLSDMKKMCWLYFYYTQINVKFCSSCIVRVSENYFIFALFESTTPVHMYLSMVYIVRIVEIHVSNNAVTCAQFAPSNI